MLRLLTFVTLCVVPVFSTQLWFDFLKGGLPISFACESTSKEIDNCTTDEDFSDKLTQEVYEASDLIAGSFSSTLTDEQLLFIRRVSQSYCPIVKKGLTCLDDALTDCTKVEARYSLDTIHQMINFVCENNSDEVINFLNGRFWKCPAPRQSELEECVDKFHTSVMGEHVEPITKTGFCSATEKVIDCSTTALRDCESSDILVKLLKSMYAYVKKYGICSTISNDSKRERVKLSLLGLG